MQSDILWNDLPVLTAQALANSCIHICERLLVSILLLLLLLFCSPNPAHRNVYQEAITSVCSVLEHYDTDNMYPVFGFGAKVPYMLVILYLTVLV